MQEADRKVAILGRLGFLSSTLIIVFIFLAVIWEVITRYLFGDSSMWVTEVSGYLLAGALFLGLGRTYRIDGHVRMSVLIDSLTPIRASRVLLLSDFVVAGFGGILLWQTWSLTLDSYQLNWRSSTNLEVPLYIPQIAMTLGAAIFLLEVILTALNRKVHSANQE